MTPAVGTRVGPYEITAKLGAGGMGEVYRARDSRLHRDVAVKLLPAAFASDPARIARFAHEAQTLAALNHPHIGQIYGIEETESGGALVMELVEGVTLAERLRQKAFTIEDAITIGRQIAAALEAAHEAGIIHRDLKPANIKLRPDGTVKVLDFGLAKSVGDQRTPEDASPNAASALATVTSPAVTLHGVILGTAAYMAPEQARGATVDRRADVWAFGCVLFEMLTGKQTFTGQSITDVLTSVMRDDPDWSQMPSETPLEVRHVLKRCFERHPGDRLRDIAEARYLLSNAGRVFLQPVVSGRPNRTLAIVAATAVAAAVVVGVIGLNWRSAVPRNAAAVVRFSIHPEARTQFAFSSNANALVPHARLSPDGRWLAFRAHGNDGVARLFVRRLDAVRATALEGTENADFVFWSPDSSQLAFFSLGQIKRIPVAGGALQVVCCQDIALRPEGTRGATWRSDGVIVFATRNALLSVDNTSLAPRPEPLVRWGSDAECRHPEFSPDHSYVFLTCTGSAAASGLFVARLGGEPKRISRSVSRAILDNDRLLYVRGGALVLQRFDSQSLELTGEPITLSDRFHLTNFGDGTFDISENGVLLYATGSPDAVAFARFDRNGQRLSAETESGQFLFAQFSPSLEYVAFDRYDPDSLTRDVWVMKLDAAAPVRLTSDDADDANPVWAPDGRSVYFVSSREPRGFFRKGISGSSAETRVAGFTTGPESTMAWPRSVSPDGRWLLYQSGRPWDLWVADLSGSGSNPFPVVSGRGNDTDAQFAPHGNAISYVSDETGREEVYAQSFPDGQRRWQVSTRGGTLPRWRPDGRELYFVAPDGMLMAATVNEANEFGLPVPLFATNIFAHSSGRARFASDRTGRQFILARMDVSGVALTVALNDPQVLTPMK